MNQRGQITISALILLPVLVVVVGGILLIALALSIEAKATTACRLRMAKSQEDAGRALSEITKLNARAKVLETSRQAAMKAVKASLLAPHPAAKAMAIATLRAVELAQAPIRKQQQYWLTYGKRASRLAPYEAKRAVTTSLPNVLRPWLLTSHLQTRSPRFRLIASSPVHRTPTYYPEPDFKNSQNGVLQWKNSVRGPVGKISFDQFSNLLPEIEIGCAMTLEPRGEAWVAQPTEDKLLSNSLSL